MLSRGHIVRMSPYIVRWNSMPQTWLCDDFGHQTVDVGWLLPLLVLIGSNFMEAGESTTHSKSVTVAVW